MKLSSVYEGFVMRHQEQVDLLKVFLSKHFPLCTTFLLGISESAARTETIFSRVSATKLWLSHYYLLVVAPKMQGMSLSALQDQVEQVCKHDFPATVIAIYEEQFNRWLGEAHPFIIAVAERGTMLTQELPLQKSNISFDQLEVSAELDHCYHHGLQMMHEFIEGAIMYRHRNQLPLAAFMLHQAAEHGLRSLLQITTGLKTNTHNLGKLVRYCSMAVHKIPEILGANTNEAWLFNKLQQAYIHARYKQYSITAEELVMLEDKINLLMYTYKKDHLQSSN
jgi:HEPN domain-containing protein